MNRPGAERNGCIEVRGARTHNLRDVSVSIPKGRITVVTGLSGSGKTSLAFDTVFAEARRRYLECLPSSARAFLEKLPHPPVDSVEGLSPAVAIGRDSALSSPRSTVATIAGFHDGLRLLFAHLGVSHCPVCGREIRATQPGAFAERLLAEPEGTKLTLMAPVLRERDAKRDGVARLRDAERAGLVRVRVDGAVRPIEEVTDAEAAAAKEIDEVLDRLVVRDGIRTRIADSVELAMRRSGGEIRVLLRRPGESEDTVIVESSRMFCPECGLAFEKPSPSSFSFNSAAGACTECRGTGTDDEGRPCRACGGRRLKPESLACTIGGLSIADVLAMPVSSLRAWCDALAEKLSGAEKAVADAPLRSLRAKLDFMNETGLDYIQADRTADSLSGGERRRVRLAAALGQNLSGVLYVLDEPSSGLHEKDVGRLVKLLLKLRDGGNTLLIVEHHPAVIAVADRVIELGPGAGAEGGNVVFSGTVEELARSKTALTAPYVAPCRAAPAERAPRGRAGDAVLSVRGACAHNLKNIDVDFRLGEITAVTGVSGAGKSSLLDEVLGENLDAWFKLKRGERRGAGFTGCASIRGQDYLGKVIRVGRAARSTSRRSNVLTFTGCGDTVCELFAATPLARQRGYGPERFRATVKGGRCEACRGEGTVRYEMSFLPDVETVCEVCGGKRFNRETLDVHWAGRSMADVFAMTVNEAAEVFEPVPKLARIFETLKETGLGYLALGQPLPTLSGGETQRLLLATELARPSRGHTLYLLDEPSSGQHPVDLERLIALLERLRAAGHTVIFVEHNPILVAAADRVIELGPVGGEKGGYIV